MKCEVVDLNAKTKGSMDLDEGVFGVEVRRDLLARAVKWQLSRRQAGTHKTKTRSEVNATRSKPFRQKGTGRARQGFSRSAQMRGGGVVFGPEVRSHAGKLPKKVRRQALRVALSAKHADGKLVVLETGVISSPKTKDLIKKIDKYGWGEALIIDGLTVNPNLTKATANIAGLSVLPSIGANVYDILRRDTLVLTKEAVMQLTERLK